MIITSQEYKDMMKGRKVSSRMEVTITSGDSVHLLTEDDIVKGSWTINWRSSNNRAFSLGTCYASSLSFSSFVSVEPEYDGQYITIEPTVYYKVDEITEAVFPLGVFRCDSPKVFSKTTSYECYDAMLAFDVRIESLFSGTPYNALTYICSKCGVQFGLTALEMNAFVNNMQNLVIDPERVNTYRDALSLISIILGGYCIINRSGQLVVRRFHTTSDMELVKWRRISTTFGGYQTAFCGVKCRFLAEQNFYPYSDIDTDIIEDGAGIILDLGDIPIIDDTEKVKKQILANIKSVVIGIRYYPCEIEMVGDPSIEAGDRITTKDRHGYDREILLTSVTYAWRAAANILSEGANPKLDAVSTQEKRAQASQDADAKASKVVTSTYVNADSITIDDTESKNITTLKFATNKDLTAIFGANIPIVASGDGYIDITYDDSGIERETFRARVHEGENLVTLVNHLFFYENSIVNLHLRAVSSGINGGDAPTLTIAQDTIRSYVFAQGIEADEAWDGVIVIEENINVVETYMEMMSITDGVIVSTQDPVDNTLTALVNAIETQMQVESISDTIQVELELGDHVLRMGMNQMMGMGRTFGT